MQEQKVYAGLPVPCWFGLLAAALLGALVALRYGREHHIDWMGLTAALALALTSVIRACGRKPTQQS